MALERDPGGDTWRLTAPVRGRADADEVRSLLNRLENGKAAAFVAESAGESELAEYGLAPPQTLELTLLVGEERAEKRLRLGAAAPDGKYYGRDMSAPQVFTVDTLLVQDVNKPLADLRDRKMFHFARSEVDRITLERPDAARIVALKDTADVWSVQEPQPLPAKSWKLSGLLTDLENMEAAGFAAEADTAAVATAALLEVTLFAGEEPLAQGRFARAAPDTMFVASAGSSVVYLVEDPDYDSVDLALEDLADTVEAQIAPAAEDSAIGGP